MSRVKSNRRYLEVTVLLALVAVLVVVFRPKPEPQPVPDPEMEAKVQALVDQTKATLIDAPQNFMKVYKLGSSNRSFRDAFIAKRMLDDLSRTTELNEELERLEALPPSPEQEQKIAEIEAELDAIDARSDEDLEKLLEGYEDLEEIGEDLEGLNESLQDLKSDEPHPDVSTIE